MGGLVSVVALSSCLHTVEPCRMNAHLMELLLDDNAMKK